MRVEISGGFASVVTEVNGENHRRVYGPEDRAEFEADVADAASYIAELGWDGWTPPPGPGVEEQRAARLLALKDRRDRAIAAGITIGDVSFATDKDSRAEIDGKALAAMLNPDLTINWKEGGQFVPLTAADIIAVKQAVDLHVQTCFDREAELLPLIEAADDPASVDISEGWPG